MSAKAKGKGEARAASIQQNYSHIFSKPLVTTNIAPTLWNVGDWIVFPDNKTESVYYFEVRKVDFDGVASGSEEQVRRYQLLCIAVNGTGQSYKAGSYYALQVNVLSEVRGTVIRKAERDEMSFDLTPAEAERVAVADIILYLQRSLMSRADHKKVFDYLVTMNRFPQDRDTDSKRRKWLRELIQRYKLHIKSTGGKIIFTGRDLPHAGAYYTAANDANTKAKIKVNLPRLVVGITNILEAFSIFDIDRNG